MYSRNHAILSALIGVPIAIGAPETQRPVLLWSSLVIIGVGIDLDHFLIGRLNRGNWTNLRRCLRSPLPVFANQESILDRGDIWRDQRLLSHLLIGGILVGVLWPVNRYWSFGTAAILYTHVISDLIPTFRQEINTSQIIRAIAIKPDDIFIARINSHLNE